MKIALVGAHNTGKTCLFHRMYSCYKFSGYEFFPEVIREVHHNGFTINERADDATQLAMCAYHLNHLSCENFVTDRCLLDNLVYATVLSNSEHPFVTPRCVHILEQYYGSTKDLIDLYIYCPISFEMCDDGIRTINKQFQEDIDREFQIMLNSLPEEKLLRVSGDTDERFSQVLTKFNELRAKNEHKTIK